MARTHCRGVVGPRTSRLRRRLHHHTHDRAAQGQRSRALSRRQPLSARLGVFPAEHDLVRTDGLGLAQVDVFEGAPSLVQVFGRDPEGRWAGSRFVTSPPDRGVEVPVRLRDEPPTPRSHAEMEAMVEARAAAHDAPLMRALERDDLSPAARAQLELWLVQNAEASNKNLDAIDRLRP